MWQVIMFDLKGENKKGTILVLLSGLCYGLVGFFGISLMELGFSVLNMLFWRFLIAFLFMLFICKKELKFLSNYNVKMLAIGGLLYVLSVYFYFVSCKYIGTSLAILIFFCYPIFVITINCFLHKIALSKYLGSISFIIFGLCLLVKPEQLKVDLLGIIFALLSSISYAAYIIYSKERIKSLSAKKVTLLVTLGCTILLLIFVNIDQSFFLPKDYLSWIYMLALSVICTILPIFLLLEGMKYISSSRASILSVLEPVVVTMIGYFFLNENLSLIQLVGIIFILFSIIIPKKLD